MKHLHSNKGSADLDSLFEKLGSDRFQRLSNVLANHSDFQFIESLGSGTFGFVFMGKLANGNGANDLVAAKLEVLDRSDLVPTLDREAQVYSAFGAKNRDDIPLPKIFHAFCFPAGKNANFFASVPLGPDHTVKLMCIEFLNVDKTRTIWKEAKDKLADDLEVTASLRYLILDTLYALLYMVQKGIAHRDFKLPHHIGYRHENEQLVVFDFGMAEVDGFCYGTSVSRPPTKINTNGISLGFVAASTTRIEPRFGRDRPGTRGYTAPFAAHTMDLGHFTDFWSAAASIVQLVRKYPSDKAECTEYQRRLVDVVKENNFEEFLTFALEGKDLGKMKESCRRLLELAYMMFRSTPFDGREKPPPKKALINFLFSEFALCSIYEEQQTELILRGEGIVIEGKKNPRGKHQRPVLLILDTFGLMVLTIFICKVGDPAGEYCGRIRILSSTGDFLSRASFSMHSVTVEPGKSLDGAPGKDLPLKTLIKAGVGSLFMSSRRDPNVSTPGNVSLVPRLHTRKTLQIDGIPLESLPMTFREDVNECTVIDWDYPWHHAQSGLGMSSEQVSKAMASNSPADIAAIEERWRPRVTELRARMLDGEFSDATKGIASSTDGDDTSALCGLLGDCLCDPDSINPARSVDCRCYSSFDPDSVPRKGNVWVEPPMISYAELSELTVVADAEDFSTMNFSARFSTAEDARGAALVQGLDRIFPEDWAAALSEAGSVADDHCIHDVFIYQGKKPYELNAGKKRKKLGYIGRFVNEPATYMRKCMDLILPNYKVAIGEPIRPPYDEKTEQCELIRETPPPEDELGEMQAVHTDVSVSNPGNFSRCMDILRKNLQLVLDSKGPVSLFFPFTSGYRLVVYLTAHKPAIECLKNFARHYKPAHDAFKILYPGASGADWKAAWCGCTVRRLRKLFPGQSFDPVCIPVELGEVLAISSFLPHCGVPVEGIRGFIAATYEVPLAMQ